MTNIALVCLANIGDGVLISPTISALAENVPNLGIILVAKPSVCELYGCDSRIKAFVPLTCSWFPGPGGLSDGIQGVWRASRLIRAYKCKVALNSASDLRTNSLLRTAGVRKLISTSARGGDFLSTSIVSPELIHVHEVDRQLKLAEAFLGTSAGKYPLNIEVGKSDNDQATELFAECAFGQRPLIAMHAGANVLFKEWPIDRFIELARYLVNQFNCRIAVLGAPGRETEISGVVVDAIGTNAINLGGRTPVRTLLAFLAQCAVYVGNDSGPMHLAAAAGCPTVALFGATNHYRFGPYLSPKLKRVVVSDLFQIETIDHARSVGVEYMSAITVNTVIEAIKSLLLSGE